MPIAPDREWRILPHERAPGPLQLARDAVAARTVAEGGPCTVRVYGWAAPGTLSLGYAQDAGVVDRAYCEDAGVDVTRRRTGGGAIYHDAAGDLAYAVTAPRAALPAGTAESYRLLLEPVLDALASLGVPARLAEERAPGRFRPDCYLRPLHAAHDLVVDAPRDGTPSGGRPDATGVRKLGGSAQRRTDDVVCQHGSLSLSVAPERHVAVFADGPSPATVERRVGSLAAFGVERSAAVRALTRSLAAWAGASPGEWTAVERERARRLAADTYRDEAWIRDRRWDDAALGGTTVPAADALGRE